MLVLASVTDRLVDFATNVVGDLGIAGIFALMIPESACIPIPSEVTLMAAGFGVHQGLLAYPVAVAAATLGNLIGSMIAYAAGRTRIGLRLPGPVAARCDRAFERYGSAAVLVARLLPLARTFVSLPAGRARVPVPSFILMTLAGCALWSAGFVLAGDLAGAAWRPVANEAGHASWLLAGLIVVCLLCYGRTQAHSRPPARDEPDR